MKEKEILKAAKKLFSKYGFKKVSMDEIAKNAGVTKKTVYANFASKEELLNNLIKLELQDMKERFEKMEKESEDFFEGINKGLITLLIFRKRNNLFKTLFEEAEILRNKSLVNSIRYIEQDVIEYIKRKLEKAEQDGYIAFDNIDVLTFLIYKMYIAMIIDWNGLYKKIDDKEISDNIIKILRNGIERKRGEND